MLRFLGILVAIAGLTACGSGVNNQGAGAAGTNCGDVDLVCVMTIELDSISIDVFASDTDLDGFPDELLETDTATLNIVINDPLGVFANIFQGVTFQTYDVSYNSGDAGAPVLGARRFTKTLAITLNNSTGAGSVEIPFVDLVTKRQYTNRTASGTVHVYVVTVRATGKDFATNTPVVVVARINVEMGDFVESVPTPPEEVMMTPTGG